MSERELLMIPGPTNVDAAVLRALSKPTLPHESLEFVAIFKETLEYLKKVFITNAQVFAISGSGTLALEMARALIGPLLRSRSWTEGCCRQNAPCLTLAK